MSFTGIGIVQMLLFWLLSLTWSFPRKAYEDKYKPVKISSLPKLHGIKNPQISPVSDFFFSLNTSIFLNRKLAFIKTSTSFLEWKMSCDPLPYKKM